MVAIIRSASFRGEHLTPELARAMTFNRHRISEYEREAIGHSSADEQTLFRILNIVDVEPRLPVHVFRVGEILAIRPSTIFYED